MSEPSRFVNKKRLANQNGKGDGLDIDPRDPRMRGCKSVDLDEILQFSAARQRALERNANIEYEQPLKNLVPNRVFINHVDGFNGKVIAEYLSERTIGVTKPEPAPVDDVDEDGTEDGVNLLDASEDEADESLKEKESSKLAQRGTARVSMEIIGTVDFMKNPKYVRPEGVAEILDEERKEEFLSRLLTCGYIIYDITNALSCHPVQIGEATWVLTSIVNQLEDVQRLAPKLFKKYKDRRTFILISPLMTWAKTKPIDPEDPSLPFTERDYRKRKPHPNYKVHCDFEKRVLELGRRFPNNLRTIIIGSGVTYGRDEDILHFLFKMAWLNAPELPLFKPGKNKIPLIHVNALANVVYQIMEDFPTSIRYIVAVEQSPTTLRKIVKLISKKLGTGKFVKVNKEDAFIYPDIKQRNFDMLTVDLNIIPGYIFNNVELQPSSEMTFKENIDTIINEYKNSRNLKPIKIFIHGPPAIGKTYLSQRLASYYKIHHLQVKEVIEQGIQSIKDKIRDLRNDAKKETQVDEVTYEVEDEGEEAADEADDAGGDDDDDEEEADSEDIETLTQLLNDIEDSMASSERGRLDEHLVMRLFKRRLLGNPCQNQGYIIDGYPKTLEDTKIFYEPDEFVEELPEDELKKVEDITRYYNKKIMPEYVASLDASDEFLIQRVIKLPQSVVQNTHYVEEDMCRRLVDYRAVNTDENTPLIFYDELDVIPIVYNVQNDDEDMNYTFQDITQRIGPPRNYAPTNYLDKLREQKEKRNEKLLEETRARARKITQERREKMENWMFMKNEEKEMEERALALLAMPLRHYLMKYIFPTLTRGLVEVARVRPSDPVDYLAEFLFKENPEGKMFHPNYDNLEEDLAHAMKDYGMSVDGGDADSSGQAAKSYSADESIVPDAISNVAEVKSQTSNVSSVSPMKRSTQVEGKGGRGPPSDADSGSAGSCRCIAQTSSRRSKCSSSSSASASTPPLPPSSCTCAPYTASSGSSKSASSSRSDGSRASCRRSSENVGPSACRCPR